LRVVILGSGGSSPDPDRSPPGQMVEVDSELLLVDCGPGTGTRIMKAGFDPKRVSRIFLTHLHIDHTLEFPSLVFGNYLLGKKDRTYLYGPPGTINFCKLLFEKLYPYAPDIVRIIRKEGLDIATHDCTERVVYETIGYRVLMTQVEHGTAITNAYRIENSQSSVVISGDTRPCESLVELAKGADLLIQECSFPDEMEEMARITNHSVPSEVGELANQAGVRKIVLTHLFPQCNGREKEMVESVGRKFKGEIIPSRDLLELTL